MSPAFRTVLRGYEPAQVDAELATLQQALDAARAELGELTVRVKDAALQQEALQTELAAARSRAEEAAKARATVSRPTFDELGARIGSMLTLAEEEADELRRTAKSDAGRLLEEATAQAAQAAAEADRYAVDTRSAADADAEARLSGAQRRADEMIDRADREAAVRREEAEAVYESQQARAAQAAADFERTLAERRDLAAADFATQIGQREDQLRAAEVNLQAAENEAMRIVGDAGSQAEAMKAAAARQAEELVSEARTKADRIRRDSDRELAAATARRDSITAQLSNVRQVLATLGGGAVVMDEAPAPEPRTESEQVAQETGEVEEQA